MEQNVQSWLNRFINQVKRFRSSISQKYIKHAVIQRSEIVYQRITNQPTAFGVAFLSAALFYRSSLWCFGHALRGLRISSNTLVLGSIGGGCSIVVSSLMSGFLFHRVVGLLAPPSNFPNATSTRGFLSDIKSFYWDKRETMEHSYSSFIFGDSLASIGSWFQFSSKQMLSSTTSQHNRLLDNHPHELITGVFLSLFAWCLFGGRWRSVAPSDLFQPGVFAKLRHRSVIKIPAARDSQPANYADATQRATLQTQGKSFGCHTCGRKRAWIFASLWRNAPGGSWVFHGDHQPPVKYASASLLNHWLLPQCPSCSAKQAIAVRTDQRTLVTHSSTRFYHLWLPYPLLSDALAPILELFT